jgi:phosphoribosylanthranilate isomerase
MKIKLCGITNRTDALNAVALNVDALGFIFYEHSPRYIRPNDLETFILDIPPFVHTVGVFVNQTADTIHRIVRQCRLTTIQLHGNESPAFCTQFDRPIIKAIPVRDANDITIIPQYKGCVAGILLDTKVDHVHGGTGKTFDWGLAISAKAYDTPLILSGGINGSNIQNAIKTVNPFGIDICSGVEKEPGIKDYNRMTQLIDTIHRV